MIKNNVEKVCGLTEIYTKAKMIFSRWQYLDIDWDKEYKKALTKILEIDNIYEYYLELMRFTALLDDGHTAVWFPDNLHRDPELGFLPIDLVYVDGKYLLSNCSKKYRDLIPQYSIIEKINGIDILKYLEKNVFPYTYYKGNKGSPAIFYLLRLGKLNEKLTFTIKTPVGEVHNIKIIRINFDDIKWVYEKKPLITPRGIKVLHNSLVDNGYQLLEFGDIGIIRIISFQYNNFAEDLWKHRELLKDKKYIIIDIRRNGGGNSVNGDKMLSMFLNEKVAKISVPVRVHYPHNYASIAWMVKEHNLDSLEKAYKIFGESSDVKTAFEVYNNQYFEIEKYQPFFMEKYKNYFKQPVVVLTSNFTGSAAEDFCLHFRQANRGIIVGEHTNGSTGQVYISELPFAGTVYICSKNSLLPDGKEFINIGIKPDYVAKLTYQDYLEHDDHVVDKVFLKACDILKHGKS